MRIHSKKLLMSLTVVVSMGYAGLAFSEDFFNGQNRWNETRMRHREMQDQFVLGICVGQELAQQNIEFPMPQPGQEPTPLDPSTQSAVESAIQNCRAELEGQNPEPSPSPSSLPSVTPSVSPSPSPAPSPTPSVSSSPSSA